MIDVFGFGPGAAAAWVVVKETAENAIAAASAIMEIVFMFHSYEQAVLFAEHARRIREYNSISIHLVISPDQDRVTLALTTAGNVKSI